MANGIARVGDTVSGTCNGDYNSWEVIGYTSPSYDEDGNAYGGGDPIYGWVTRNENGTFTGTITGGSNTVFVDNKKVARIGDTINITKSYPNGNHFDSLNVNGIITSGSSIVFADNIGVAYIGCSITAPNVTSGTITSGSNTVFV